MIPHNTLILVADGGKAMMFRNHGNGGEVSLTDEGHLTPKQMVNDGPSGARPADQSISQTHEATFAKHLAQSLHAMKEAGDFKDLVLIADAKTLGEIRGAMHKAVAASVIKTLSKDLTNHSIKDITAALT